MLVPALPQPCVPRDASVVSPYISHTLGSVGLPPGLREVPVFRTVYFGGIIYSYIKEGTRRQKCCLVLIPHLLVT